MVIKNNDRKRIGLFIVIIVQVLICLLWANSRENLYWDEYYSFENAHYVGTDDVEHYYTADENFKVNVWDKYDNCLDDAKDKVYTRDVFERD